MRLQAHREGVAPPLGILFKPTGAWFEEAPGVRGLQRFPGGPHGPGGRREPQVRAMALVTSACPPP